MLNFFMVANSDSCHTLSEVYEHVIDVSLMLEMFFTQDS